MSKDHALRKHTHLYRFFFNFAGWNGLIFRRFWVIIGEKRPMDRIDKHLHLRVVNVLDRKVGCFSGIGTQPFLDTSTHLYMSWLVPRSVLPSVYPKLIFKRQISPFSSVKWDQMRLNEIKDSEVVASNAPYSNLSEWPTPFELSVS